MASSRLSRASRFNTLKPLTFTGVDPSSSISYGLTFYALFNEGSGLPRTTTIIGSPPLQATTSTANSYTGWKNGKLGPSLNLNGNVSYWFERGAWVEPTSKASPDGNVALTCAGYVRRNVGDTVQYSRPFGKTNNNGGAGPFVSFDVEYNPGGAGFNVVSANTNGSNSLVSSSQVTITNASVPHLIGVHVDFSNRNGIGVVYNGFLLGFTNAQNLGNIVYDTTTAGRMIISGSSAAAVANAWNGEVYWVGVWNRLLSPTEWRFLYESPYGFLSKTTPKRRNRLIQPAAVVAAAIVDESFAFSMS